MYGRVLVTTRIYLPILSLWEVIGRTFSSDLDERRGKKGRKKVDREKGEGRRKEKERRGGREEGKNEGWKRKDG